MEEQLTDYTLILEEILKQLVEINIFNQWIFGINVVISVTLIIIIFSIYFNDR